MTHPSQNGAPTATNASQDRQLNCLWHCCQQDYTAHDKSNIYVLSLAMTMNNDSTSTFTGGRVKLTMPTIGQSIILQHITDSCNKFFLHLQKKINNQNSDRSKVADIKQP